MLILMHMTDSVYFYLLRYYSLSFNKMFSPTHIISVREILAFLHTRIDVFWSFLMSVEKLYQFAGCLLFQIFILSLFMQMVK